MTAVGRPDNGQDEGPWRVGSHYGIHVYKGGDPVATFLRPENAAEAVAAVNAQIAARPGAGEQQRERVATELERHHQLLGPREADQPATWFNWCKCGWDGGPVEPGLDAVKGYALQFRLHVADELLALLAHTDEEAR